MLFSFLIAQQALAGSFESAQLDGTAHAPRRGDFFLRPLGDTTFGVTDRLALSSNAIGWVQNTPNLSAEYNLVDDWGWALSVSPYVKTDSSLSNFQSGASVTHSLQYAEDRLNTTVRVGYVGQRNTNTDTDNFATGTLEGELGVSYDIVVSKGMIHRFKSSLTSGMDLSEGIDWTAGYSFHTVMGERARLQLGVDFGAPSSFVGEVFNENYRQTVYGDDIAMKNWAPSPNASIFWVF